MSIHLPEGAIDRQEKVYAEEKHGTYNKFLPYCIESQGGSALEHTNPAHIGPPPPPRLRSSLSGLDSSRLCVDLTIKG